MIILWLNDKKKNSIGTKDTNLSLSFKFGNVVSGHTIRTSKTGYWRGAHHKISTHR